MIDDLNVKDMAIIVAVILLAIIPGVLLVLFWPV